MSERHIGFTGTQEGMSELQQKLLHDILAFAVKDGDTVVFHHGDCIGADEQAHEIALTLGCKIHIHPPVNGSKRAFCDAWDAIYESKPYLDRNKDIVNSSIGLIAAPKTTKEEQRSGTWSTVRYATKNNKPIIILPRRLKETV